LQPKLDDGWRVIADLHTGRVFTRSGSGRDLAHVKHAFSELPRTDFRYVDGELMHPNGPHYIPSNLTEEPDVLQLHIFDAVLTDLAFSQRHALLSDWFTARPPAVDVLQLVPTHDIGQRTINSSIDELQDAALTYQREGYEGAILRLDEAREGIRGYQIEGNRSLNVIKCKTRQEDEFEIKVLEETRKGSEQLGRVRCHRNAPGRVKHFTAKVGENWTDERRRDAWKDRTQYAVKHVPEDKKEGFEPKWMAVVEHTGIDKSGRPQGAKLVDFRHKDDMPPVRTCVFEPARISPLLPIIDDVHFAAGRNARRAVGC
jgi:ATP-dependent DNA ligase